MTLPASTFVEVIPGVLGAGGNPLSPNTVFLSTDVATPIGKLLAFPNAAAVASFYGANSPEANLAAIYFSGRLNGASIPSVLYIAQANPSAVAGYLRGGSVAGVPLTTLQALSGTLTLTIDGVSTVSAAINLSAATSYSNAASLIQTGIEGGTPTNTATVTYDSQRAAFVITSPTTGVSSAIGIPSTDSLATGLKLTAATGALQSPGAVTAVPATLMTSITALSQNWISFMTTVEQSLSNKEAYAAWVQTTNERFKYVCQDSDVTALTPNASGCFGAINNAAGNVGVVVIYDNSGGTPGSSLGYIAAFECACTGSIDTTVRGGRFTYAFKQQAGIAPQITDPTQYLNLVSNGYNAYVATATANQAFTFYQPGSTSGDWLWDDAYTTQILLNAALQLALIELLASANAVPYVAAGYDLIKQACADPVNEFLNWGGIVPGVELSASQAAEVNVAAGVKIDQTLTNLGWYLQVLDPGAIVRGNRGSPACKFWYTDGGAVQLIDLQSTDVQ